MLTLVTPNFLNTYLLTPRRFLLEKLTGFQPVKKFPAFYGARRFITAVTSICTHIYTYLVFAYFLQECVREIMKFNLMAIILIKVVHCLDQFDTRIITAGTGEAADA